VSIKRGITYSAFKVAVLLGFEWLAILVEVLGSQAEIDNEDLVLVLGEYEVGGFEVSVEESRLVDFFKSSQYLQQDSNADLERDFVLQVKD
jgi:hypothetical protein